MTTMRLQRALARAGVASRRRAEDLIRAGRVKVNGRVAELGESVDPDTDRITVGGRRITQSQNVWIMELGSASENGSVMTNNATLVFSPFRATVASPKST